jgi:hypothetical protein
MFIVLGRKLLVALPRPIAGALPLPLVFGGELVSSEEARFLKDAVQFLPVPSTPTAVTVKTGTTAAKVIAIAAISCVESSRPRRSRSNVTA